MIPNVAEIPVKSYLYQGVLEDIEYQTDEPRSFPTGSRKLNSPVTKRTEIPTVYSDIVDS